MKILSLVRDPYEVVLKGTLASLAKKKGWLPSQDGQIPFQKFMTANNDSGLFELPLKLVIQRSQEVNKEVQVAVRLQEDPRFDVKVFQLDEVTSGTRNVVLQLCDWLNLKCFDDYVNYIENCALAKARVRKYLFVWPKKVKSILNGLILAHPAYYHNGSRYLI